MIILKALAAELEELTRSNSDLVGFTFTYAQLNPRIGTRRLPKPRIIVHKKSKFVGYIWVFDQELRLDCITEYDPYIIDIANPNANITQKIGKYFIRLTYRV